MINKEKDYLSTRDAAAILNVAVSTIQLWVDNGTLRAWTTVGGHRRIAKDAVTQMSIEQKNISNFPTIKKKKKSQSIVIVEDNNQDRSLYERQFKAWDLHADIHLSKDGYEGLINIGKSIPSIIITDLMMPNISGFEMVKAIKEIPELKESMLLVVSALSDKEIKERGGLPFDVLVLRKPLQFDILKTLVYEQLRLNTVQNKLAC